MRNDYGGSLVDRYSQLPAYRPANIAVSPNQYRRGTGGRGRVTAQTSAWTSGARGNAPGVQQRGANGSGDRFAETLGDVTREYDEALLSQSSRCKALDYELTALREDLHLERAANADLRSELREHQRHNALLQHEVRSSISTVIFRACEK